MDNVMTIIPLVLKVVGLAMGIASVVLGIVAKDTDMDTHVTLLGIGLAALGIASLM